MPQHLFVALSGHGYGHLAQVAPVLNELRRRLPDLALTLQCSLPARILHQRIEGGFELLTEATDFGMVMSDAVTVRPADSLAAYREFHADWEFRLVRQAALLERLRPDVLFADIPYLPLAAAHRVGLPAVALCSLNWADLLTTYCPDAPDLAELRRVLLEAYASAQVFLRPAPSMPMPDLSNTQAIGPVATLGRDRRAEVANRLGLGVGERLGLIALGGVDMNLPMAHWPRLPGWRWLAPAAWRVARSDVHNHETLADLPFVDVLCSCDLLLTKPGYGSFAEAACNGVPVLYLERDDWPETPWLAAWLETHGRAMAIDRRRLEAGDLRGPLAELMARPVRPRPRPDGVMEAVTCLQAYFRHP